MSAALKVGDIAIGQNFIVNIERNGMECEIIGGLEMRLAHCVNTGEITECMRYKVRWADGLIWNQKPPYLRKKHPPSQPSASARQAMLDCIRKAQQPAKVGAPC